MNLIFSMINIISKTSHTTPIFVMYNTLILHDIVCIGSVFRQTVGLRSEQLPSNTK